MKSNIKIFLKPKEEKEVSFGFPWVYDNEISSVRYISSDSPETKNIKTSSIEDCDVKDGSVCEVYSSSGLFLGSGVINRKSKITVRLLSPLHADSVMENPKSFWLKKVRDAVNFRRISFSDNESCRLVFGEADFIPGLIAEKYVSEGKIYLVLQFLALACEVFRNEILSALKETVKPDFIYERSDASVRKKEGLPEVSGWIGKKGEEVIKIQENGIFLLVDIAHGQKTGYFLDQKFNRERIRRFCHGKKVLDAFSHTGSFALNAVSGGARSVTCIDIASDAVSLIEKNIALNKAEEKVSVICGDVFDFLKKYEAEEEKFDVIILDPPAFTKKAGNIDKAYGGYKEINLRAMRVLQEGGILVTCSCSSYFDENKFYSMLSNAAKDSHKKLQIIERLSSSSDHPVLLGYPGSNYLKCAVCRVL